MVNETMIYFNRKFDIFCVAGWCEALKNARMDRSALELPINNRDCC